MLTIKVCKICWFCVHLPLLGLELVGRNRFAAAGLRLGVVGGAAGTLLRVLALTHLGPSILEPYLSGTKRIISAKVLAKRFIVHRKLSPL